MLRSTRIMPNRLASHSTGRTGPPYRRCRDATTRASTRLIRSSGGDLRATRKAKVTSAAKGKEANPMLATGSSSPGRPRDKHTHRSASVIDLGSGRWSSERGSGSPAYAATVITSYSFQAARSWNEPKTVRRFRFTPVPTIRRFLRISQNEKTSAVRKRHAAIESRQGAFAKPTPARSATRPRDASGPGST